MYGLWKQKCPAIAQSKWAGTEQIITPVTMPGIGSARNNQ